MNDLSWDDIRYFLALKRHRTLTAAGRHLGVSHVTVARRIAHMEDALGQVAFERHPGEYVLSVFGERLVEAAEQMERATLQLLRLSGAHDDTVEGKCRLAIGGFTGLILGMPLAAELRLRHPSLEIEFLEGGGLVDLRRGEADLAIRIQLSDEVPADDEMIIRALGTFDWAFFGSESLIVETGLERLDQLDDVPLVVFSDLAPGKLEREWMKGRGTPRVVASSNAAIGVLAGAINGAGFAPCPVPLARKFGLRQVTEPLATSRIFVAMHPDLRRSARVRAASNFIYEYCAERPELFGTAP